MEAQFADSYYIGQPFILEPNLQVFYFVQQNFIGMISSICHCVPICDVSLPALIQ